MAIDKNIINPEKLDKRTLKNLSLRFIKTENVLKVEDVHTEPGKDFIYIEGDVSIISCPKRFARMFLDDQACERLKHEYKGEVTPRYLKWSRVPPWLVDIYFSKESVDKIHAYKDRIKREEAENYGKYNTMEYFNECQAKINNKCEPDITADIKRFIG